MNNNIKKILIISAGIIVFIIRLTGDIIFLSFNNKLLLVENSTWNLISSFFIVCIVVYYFYEESKSDFNLKYDELIPFFTYSYYQTTFLTATVFIIYILSQNLINIKIEQGNYILLIIKTFVFFYMIVVSTLILGFILKWIWSRKKKNTKEVLIVLGIVTPFFVLLNSFVINEVFFDILKLWAIIIVSFLMIVLIFYLPVKSDWVANLSKKVKYKILFQSFLNVIFGIVIVFNSFTASTIFFDEFNNLYQIAANFFNIIFALYTVMSLKLFITIMNLVPSSVLFTKKNTEINNLAFLIRFISESVNQDDKYILSSIAELAIKTTNSDGGWAELYSDSNEYIYTSKFDINFLKELNNQIELIENIKNYNNVELVESVYEHSYFSKIVPLTRFIRSMIIIPVFCFEKKIGTIIIFKNIEYSLDYEDIQLMKAFSDNLKLALENSKLLQESIEKEKYKNELLLAKEIQSKLLPQYLPEITNYSISALSLPSIVVGGDYYDIVQLQNKKYCIIVGDVSGKGMIASFYMAQLKGIVISLAKKSKNGYELLCGINEALFKNIESKMFITLSTLVINDDEGNISIARAGHLPFIIKNNNKIELFKTSGIAAGLAGPDIFDKHLEEINVKLYKDSFVIILTDGINELNTYNHNEIGYEPLIDILQNYDKIDTEDYIKLFKNLINPYIDKNINHDDMTLVVLKYFNKSN